MVKEAGSLCARIFGAHTLKVYAKCIYIYILTPNSSTLLTAISRQDNYTLRLRFKVNVKGRLRLRFTVLMVKVEGVRLKVVEG